jgi:hypothetical protein
MWKARASTLFDNRKVRRVVGPSLATSTAMATGAAILAAWGAAATGVPAS